MRPNPCCNHAHHLNRKRVFTGLVDRVKRKIGADPLPHRLVERCKVCGCNHYIMIVPEIPVVDTGYGMGT